MWMQQLLWALVGHTVALAAPGFWPQPDRVTQENVNRIPLGMSRAKVEAILGGPPGDYRTVRTMNEELDKCGGDVNEHAERHDAVGYRSLGPLNVRNFGIWVGNEGYTFVCFNNGAVVHRYFMHTVKQKQS